jgi:hypothetical protein
MITLDEILDLDDSTERGYDAERTVGFELTEDKMALEILEQCDQYFGIKLTPVEVDQLISFIMAQRAEMVE